MKCFLYLTIAICASTYATKLHPLSDKFIESINNKKTTWKAGRNFNENTPLSNIKHLLGVLPRTEPHTLPMKTHQVNLADIPESFDAREAWPECASIIGNIRDQSTCGSCWAFGAVEAMSDRICIHSNATTKVHVSAEDLLDCCLLICGMGCNGGFPESAWLHWSINGIVTGGNYGTTDGCKAYSFAPCEHHTEGDLPACGDLQPTPSCNLQCDSGSSQVYNEDLTRGSGYGIASDIAQIQKEIMTNGPVEADYDVYEDFLSYKSGVYQHVSGEFAGGHAIKILGWGVEDDTPYWLAANSWNEDWGDKGYFKILRGANECGIESDILGGIPSL